jgi:hypothetical protein
MATFLDQVFEHKILGHFVSSKYEISMNDLIQEGKWTWVSDHSTIGYSNWAKGEPNNDRGVDDCGQLYCNQHSFPWKDAACSELHV